MANRFTWNGLSGLLSDPDNWTDQTSGTPGPPSLGDVAEFLNFSPVTLTGIGGAQFASFQSPSPIKLTGTLHPGGQAKRPVPAQCRGVCRGAVLARSRSTAEPDDAAGGIVRIDGTASAVAVENGGTVRSLGTSVGASAGQSGSLLLTGIGTSWTDLSNPLLDIPLYRSGFTTVGLNGTGTLTVTAGAALTTDRTAEIGPERRQFRHCHGLQRGELEYPQSDRRARRHRRAQRQRRNGRRQRRRRE